MKLALIADVHGNLEALDAVLAQIDRLDPGPQLVCAGDLVGYGPDPDACIERLRQRGALCVKGNHEEMVLGHRDFSRCVYAGIVAAAWTRRCLSASGREFLEQLPLRIEAAPGVTVCHGNLASADTYVSTPERAAEAMQQLRFIRPQSRILVCGHTHHQALSTPASGFRTVAAPGEYELDPEAPCLVNPGAVGQARDGTAPLARWAVLDLDRWRVSYRETTFDHPTTLRKLREARLVAQVVSRRPRGLHRLVERYKARWAAWRAQR
ncbi:MAG TPA: metallophosphoesterase family protein [Planctomycetota bacterium]